MTSTTRTFVAAGAAVVTLVGVWNLMATPSEAPVARRETAVDRAPTERPTAPADPAQADRPAGMPRGDAEAVSYAIAVSELHGLSPQAAPGTELEVWVAWEPPVSKGPEIHRLLDSVILEEITPPLLPDGPQVAMLLVPRKGLSDLLYGDRYGALSVAVPQRSGAGG